MPALNASPRRALGLSTLLMLMGLFLVTALATAFANRHLLVEQRMARALEDDARAQSAAEWGAEHALGLLNAAEINDQCQAAPLSDAALPAATRWLQRDALERWQVLTPGAAMACDAAGDEAWRCRCAREAVPVPMQDTPDAHAQAVRVELQTLDDEPQVLRLRVLGCAQGSAECRRDSPWGSVARSQARVHALQQHIAWLPALRQLPASALLSQGAVDLGDGLQLHNDDPHTQGLALHAGGPVSGSTAGLAGLPGSLVAERWLGADPSLSSLGESGLLRRLLGRRLDGEASPPSLHRVACARACDAETVSAAWRQGHRWVQVEGDLELREPVAWGEASRPLLLTVQGQLRWTGGGRFVGALLVGGDADLEGRAWQTEGALVVGGRVRADGQGRVMHQREVLRRLQREVGSFVRLAGGRWRSA